MKDYHVFISYSRDDDPDFANSQSPISQILNRFEKARLKPWIDREGKYIGENYLREIVKGIDNSEMMLFVSSKNSNNSYYALKEVCYAADNKMKILPLLLDDSPFNEDIKLLFSAKDKRWFHPNTSKTLEELTDSIKKYIDDIAKKEREKAEAEEAERRRIEAENERKRVEAEEKIRIAKLEKEIENIKKRIIDYVEKQQACMKDLLAKEKDLNNSSDGVKECPVCQTSITDLGADYCDICGWHFATPKELVSPEMQKMYEERLHASQTIWIEKQQRKEEIKNLKKEISTLTSQSDKIRKELIDWKNKYNTNSEENKKLIQAKLDEISKLKKELYDLRNKYNSSSKNNEKEIQTKLEEVSKVKNELDDTKNQLSKAHQMISELFKKKPDNHHYENSNFGKQAVAFLLVNEFDQMNVYCLYEGRNIFGTMEAAPNQSDYQMLVVSDNSLNSQHFEVCVRKENKSFTFTVSPINDSCVMALNSQANYIKGENSVQINDMLFIGNVRLQIIDNFNKKI